MTKREEAEALWTTKDVAAYLSISQPTLSRWRQLKTGPKFVNLGGIFRYRPEDVRAYVAEKVSQ